jgi:nitrite reductase/ring-hydroxylating ferredoxin subunit
MGNLVKVASVADVPNGKGIGVEAGGERIALFQVDGVFYAIGDTCPHRGGPLSGGVLDGTTVTCPWHGAEFDVCTGKNLCPPGARPVVAYPVKVEDGQVLIELP